MCVSRAERGQPADSNRVLRLIRMTALIVSLEGNIGAGKTSILNRLSPSYLVLPEPVDLWEPELTDFYNCRPRSAISLQLKILRTTCPRPDYSTSRTIGGPRRHACLDVCCRRTIILVERSPPSSLVFVQNLLHSKRLSSAEYEHYMRQHAKWSWTPDVTIFVDVDPATCFARATARNRRAEHSLSLQYLRNLDLLFRACNYTHRVDGTGPPDQVAQQVYAILHDLHDRQATNKCSMRVAALAAICAGLIGFVLASVRACFVPQHPNSPV